MPVITVTLVEGYSEATRRDFEERLTDAARLAIGAAPDGITVIIHEVPAANYMRGRRPKTPGLPPPPPAQLVLDYLVDPEPLSPERQAVAAARFDGFALPSFQTVIAA